MMIWAPRREAPRLAARPRFYKQAARLQASRASTSKLRVATLASIAAARHNAAMRFSLILLVTLILAACGTTTPQSSVVVGTRLPPAVIERGDLIGLDAAALLTRFGRPRLQVKEGDGTKLQFAAGSCLLDAYLYPQGGTPRVTHVDTRNRDGRDVPQASCLAMLSER